MAAVCDRGLVILISEMDEALKFNLLRSLSAEERLKYN